MRSSTWCAPGAHGDSCPRIPALADRVLVLHRVGGAKVTQNILAAVRTQLRVEQGRNPQPSSGLVDFQTSGGADSVGSG
jgi:hypothetical protein